MFAAVYRAVATVARLVACAGVLMLVVTMLLTVADVLLRQTAKIAVAGTVDITQLLVMAAVFTAIPFAFFSDSHVVIELATERLRPRVVAMFRAIAAVAALAFLGYAFRYGWDTALQQHGYGDRSQTIGIPILFYWVPLLAGFALSAVAAALIAVRYALFALRGEDPVR
jgi:TRAP-type C4-dicarboxylate transport system permease small subunit